MQDKDYLIFLTALTFRWLAGCIFEVGQNAKLNILGSTTARLEGWKRSARFLAGVTPYWICHQPVPL